MGPMWRDRRFTGIREVLGAALVRYNLPEIELTYIRISNVLSFHITPSMLLKKIPRIYQQVTENSRSGILSHCMAGGRIEPDIEFARTQGVSPATIRSAFVILPREGLVERTPRRGLLCSIKEADSMSGYWPKPPSCIRASLNMNYRKTAYKLPSVVSMYPKTQFHRTK